MNDTIVVSHDDETAIVMVDGQPVKELDWNHDLDYDDNIQFITKAAGFEFISVGQPEGSAMGWDVEVQVKGKPVFTVEIPHQKKPICWVADDKDDFIAKTATYLDNFQLTFATFEDAVHETRRDLSDLKVFTSADDAARGYLEGWTGHQAPAAMDALLNALRDYSWMIEDPTLRLKIVGAIWDRAKDDEREIAGSAYDAVKDAADAGFPETQIADLLRVNRITVRRALGKMS